MDGADEDVNHFRFGKLGTKDTPIEHLSNAHIVVLLKSMRAKKMEEAPNQRLPECVKFIIYMGGGERWEMGDGGESWGRM